MKQFIVMMCFLPIMVILIATPIQFEKNFAKENKAREITDNLTQIAAQEGYFASGDLAKFQKKIAKLMKCDEEDIDISIDSAVRYRPETIHYRFEIPMSNVVPGASFFGIRKSENVRTIVIEGEVVSERLVDR